MQLQIRHTTRYRYRSPSLESHNELRLAPLSDVNQTCREFRLEVNPHAKIFAHREVGGVVHHFNIREPHEELEITARAVVDTWTHNPFHALNLLEDDFAFYQRDATRQAFVEFLTPSRYVPASDEAREIAGRLRQPGQSVATFLLNLNRHLHEWLEYDPDATHVHSTLPEVLEKRAGVCQDFAHIMLACARSQGIPTRYVSGYLYVAQGSGMRGDQASHAWVECLLPDGRWLGIDPTNNLLANDRYVKVHVGRDYADCSPVKGIYVGRPAERLTVVVEIQRDDLFADDKSRKTSVSTMA